MWSAWDLYKTAQDAVWAGQQFEKLSLRTSGWRTNIGAKSTRNCDRGGKPVKLHRSIVLFCGLAATARAQQIECLRDVPFTATRTYASPTGSYTETIARSSNGSTYVEQHDQHGKTVTITIRDIPGQRVVTLFVTLHQYAIMAHMDPANFKTYSVQEWLQILRGRSFTRGQTDLGTKTEDGMTLFGMSLYLNNLTSERWDAAELGTTYRYDMMSPEGLRTFRLSDIRLGEPSSLLFEIAAGYGPATVVDH